MLRLAWPQRSWIIRETKGHSQMTSQSVQRRTSPEEERDRGRERKQSSMGPRKVCPTQMILRNKAGFIVWIGWMFSPTKCINHHHSSFLFFFVCLRVSNFGAWPQSPSEQLPGHVPPLQVWQYAVSLRTFGITSWREIEMNRERTWNRTEPQPNEPPGFCFLVPLRQNETESRPWWGRPRLRQRPILEFVFILVGTSSANTRMDFLPSGQNLVLHQPRS